MRCRSRRRLLHLGSCVLLVGGGLLAACSPAPRNDGEVGSSLRLLEPPPTTRVVIATLESGDAPLSETRDGILLSQLLQLCLDGGGVEVYAPEQTALLELQGLLSPDPTMDQMQRVHELTGADAMLTGIVRKQERALQVELTFASTASTASAPIVISRSADEAHTLRLAGELASEIRGRLTNADEDPGADPACSSSASMPLETDSLRVLTEGRRRLWLSDPAAAAELIGRAAAEETDRALPHLELAKTLLVLGSFARAREEATRAAGLTAAGPAGELQQARVLTALLAGRPRRAAELQREGIAKEPWSAESRFALVRTLLRLEDGEAAFAAIAQLRSLPLGTYDRLRIELLAASAAQVLGDLAGWRLLAETARDRARESGFALLEAESWIHLSRAHRALGHAGEAAEAAQAARRIFLRLSHRRQAAMALAVAAMGQAAGGDSAAARRLLLQSAAELRRERDPGNVASVLHNLGVVELREGSMDAAAAYLREALDLRRSLADSVGAARSLLRLAEAQARDGHFDEADASYGRGLAVLDEDGLSPQEGSLALELAARLSARAGAASSPPASSTVEATRRRVLAIAAEAGDRRLEALAHCDLGEALMGGGELGAARAELEKSLALFGELEDASGTARARLLLASVAMEAEQFNQATTLARQVLEWALVENDAAHEAVARSILAWSHLRLGRQSAADDETERAREAAFRVTDPTARLTVLVAAARLEAIVHPAAEAPAELVRLLDEARRLGLARMAAEVELAIGEIEMERGDIESGRRRLAALAQQADRAGWGLLASKARRVSGNDAS